MNAGKKQLEFIEKCPAWVREIGISSLLEWELAKRIMPFEWPDRFDGLDEAKSDGEITGVERMYIVKVLEAWDAMAGTRQ